MDEFMAMVWADSEAIFLTHYPTFGTNTNNHLESFN